MKKAKNKSSKTILKRIVKRCRGGTIIVRSTSSQHLATNKSKRRRKTSGNKVALSAADRKKIRKAI